LTIERRAGCVLVLDDDRLLLSVTPALDSLYHTFGAEPR